jgi:hypothetical protein
LEKVLYHDFYSHFPLFKALHVKVRKQWSLYKMQRDTFNNGIVRIIDLKAFFVSKKFANLLVKNIKMAIFYFLD